MKKPTYYSWNVEGRRQYAKDYRKKNAKRLKEYQAQYRIRNKEKRNASSLAWAHARRDRERAIKIDLAAWLEGKLDSVDLSEAVRVYLRETIIPRLRRSRAAVPP